MAVSLMQNQNRFYINGKFLKEIIVPSAYSILLKTAGGIVQITEDKKGVYLTENGQRKILTSGKLNLQSFILVRIVK